MRREGERERDLEKERLYVSMCALGEGRGWSRVVYIKVGEGA